MRGMTALCQETGVQGVKGACSERVVIVLVLVVVLDRPRVARP
jgi:hypothetical protein